MAKEKYHDKGYKELLSKRRNFIKFLRHFVKNDWVKRIDEESLHLCDKGFVDPFFKELESDLIYSAKVAEKDVYFYVLTELQSATDPTMPFRMFKYISAILMRAFNNTPKEIRQRLDFRLPAVVPIVLYNGESKWPTTRNFKDYLQDGHMFEGVIDFQYTLVDINLLDREYLIKHHDAICAALAVDMIRGEKLEQLRSTLKEIIHSKSGFDPDEFMDFLDWLKHTLKHRVKSEEDADKVIQLIEKGDEAIMRTGIDIVFDNMENAVRLETAAELIKSGLDFTDIANRLNLTNEQRDKLAEDIGLVKEFA